MNKVKPSVLALCTISLLIVLSCAIFPHPVLAGVGEGTVTAYGWNAHWGFTGLSKGPVSIVIPAGNLTLIKSDETVEFMSGGDFVEETWYTVSYSYSGDSYLYTIDPHTGDKTTVGSIGIPYLTGFTYDLTTQTAYVSAHDSSSKLYTIDLATAQVTLVGEITPGIIIGIAADAAGNLYGLDINDDSLYNIDKTTGQGTAIGSTGLDLNFAQDIAFDRDNGTLYGALYAMGGGLYQIDVNTGTATLLAEYGDEIDALAIPYTTIKYTVAVSASPSSGGTVTGSGEYSSGASVTVSAAAAEGYEFVNWTEGGVEVSAEPVYNFTAAINRNLVANFTLSTIPVSGVSLNQTALSLPAGGAPFQLMATVAPEGATNKNIRWSSSDESVATVNSAGLVTAAGAGRAVITVTTEDGNFTAECTVTVTASKDSAVPEPENELPRTGAYPDILLSLGALLTAGGLFYLRFQKKA